MSYDFRLCYKKSKKTVTTKGLVCNIIGYGGTIAVDCKTMQPLKISEFDFNMTYNYSGLLYKYLDDEKGLRYLYNNDFMRCVNALENAILKIRSDYVNVLDMDVDGREPDKLKYNDFLHCDTYDIPEKKPTITQMEKQKPILDDYWACTPRNVIKALQHILDCCYWVMNKYPKKTYMNFTFDGD